MALLREASFKPAKVIMEDVLRRTAVRIQTLDDYHPLRSRLSTQIRIGNIARRTYWYLARPISIEDKRKLPSLVSNKKKAAAAFDKRGLDIVRVYSDGSKLEDKRTG